VWGECSSSHCSSRCFLPNNTCGTPSRAKTRGSASSSR
jgi:hypothetical protein